MVETVYETLRIPLEVLFPESILNDVFFGFWIDFGLWMMTVLIGFFTYYLFFWIFITLVARLFNWSKKVRF